MIPVTLIVACCTFSGYFDVVLMCQAGVALVKAFSIIVHSPLSPYLPTLPQIALTMHTSIEV